MRRHPLMAGAIALGLLLAGGLAACNPDDVGDVAIPALKAMAVKVAVKAAAGDTRSREVVLGIADGYCDVAETDRVALRRAFTDAGGRAAFAVDCDAVRALAGRKAEVDPPMTPRMRRFAAIAAATDPHRRE